MSEKDYKCDLKELAQERLYVSFVKNYTDEFLPLHASRNINKLKDLHPSKIGVYYEEDLILRLRSSCRTRDLEIKKLQVENEKLKECVEFYADINDEMEMMYDIRGISKARECLKEIGGVK